MLFDEIYSCYYNTVAQILSVAVKGNLTDEKMKRIIDEKAFSESFLTIIPALKEHKWQLIGDDMSTPIKHEPTIPLTLLERRWLKAISLDKRIQLFDIDMNLPDDIEPLFTPDDFVVFDKYSDGDNFEDENYMKNFHTILTAIKSGRKLHITYTSNKGINHNIVCAPKTLEYSEKDDKFRLFAFDGRMSYTVNLATIEVCNLGGEYKNRNYITSEKDKKYIVMELVDERNALERIMLHFAHFEKQAEKLDGNHYRLKVFYNGNDETELVIRVLSFGPLVKVVEPEHVVGLIRQRLIMQKKFSI